MVCDVAIVQPSIGTVEGANAQTVVSDVVVSVFLPHQEGVVIVCPLVATYCWVGCVHTLQEQGLHHRQHQGGGSGGCHVGRGCITNMQSLDGKAGMG